MASISTNSGIHISVYKRAYIFLSQLNNPTNPTNNIRDLEKFSHQYAQKLQPLSIFSSFSIVSPRRKWLRYRQTRQYIYQFTSVHIYLYPARVKIRTRVRGHFVIVELVIISDRETALHG